MKAVLGAAAFIVLIGAMALDTKVVVIGSGEDVSERAFSPEQFGREMFPQIRESVMGRAVDAVTLAEAIAADKAAAGEQYGVKGGVGPVMPVRFTGVAGEARSGVYTVKVKGVPEEIVIRVQTGPAINGTDLRDATGTISFGQFTNQIEYQDAGSGINNEMKRQVLAKIDTKNLTGKTISVVGVFRLINPKNWLVTPVEMSVQ
jgi:predicted lipoprotein